jgi:DNA-binding transcriptional MerR regulator
MGVQMDFEMLTIREVARQTGVSSKTLRYWEGVRLLPRAIRNYNGYRLYKPEVIKRVMFIRKAKGLGFTIAEIRELFHLAGRKSTVCADVARWTAQKIQNIERQLTLLSQLRDRLIAHQKEWKKRLPCPPLSPSEICCLIDALPINSAKEGGEALAILRKPLTRYAGRHTPLGSGQQWVM